MLFSALLCIEGGHPGLLDHLEGSIEHLGDEADDDSKDDEAVREAARRSVAGPRRAAGGEGASLAFP